MRFLVITALAYPASAQSQPAQPPQPVVQPAPQPEAAPAPTEQTAPLEPAESSADSVPPPSGDDAALAERKALEERAEAIADEAADKKKDEKAKEQKKQGPDVDVTGRIYMRSTLTRQDWGWVNELDLDSARMSAKYRHRAIGLRTEITLEVAGNRVSIRDGYLRYDPTSRLHIRAGRFKRPISVVYLTSRWDLPVAERGLISDLELYNELTGEPDVLPISDRADGLELEWSPKKLPWSPKLTVGVFRGEAQRQLAEGLGMNRRQLALGEAFAEDVYGRAEVEPILGLYVGLSGAVIGILETAGTRDSFRHGMLGSVDMYLEPDPVGLWLEGFVGSSPFHLGTPLRAEGLFVATRAIAMWRMESPSNVLAYLEPHFMIQFMDASTESDNDSGWEVGGGMNMGINEQLKLQLQASHQERDTLLGAGSTVVIVQLGAIF